MFVIKRITDGKYVARYGNKSSYTKEIHLIRTFLTEADAIKELCGNEIVVNLTDILSGGNNG